jgi:predicted RNA-binding protein with EMAP domain
MEMQTLIDTAVGAGFALGGWLGRQVWDAVQKMKEDIHRLEVDLPSNYIRKDEFTDAMREIKDMLAKIFDKLDAKADK